MTTSANDNLGAGSVIDLYVDLNVLVLTSISS